MQAGDFNFNFNLKEVHLDHIFEKKLQLIAKEVTNLKHPYDKVGQWLQHEKFCNVAKNPICGIRSRYKVIPYNLKLQGIIGLKGDRGLTDYKKMQVSSMAISPA